MFFIRVELRNLITSSLTGLDYLELFQALSTLAIYLIVLRNLKDATSQNDQVPLGG